MSATREIYGLNLDVLRPARGAGVEAAVGGISATHDGLCLIGATYAPMMSRAPVELFTDDRGAWKPSDRSPACAVRIHGVVGVRLASIVPAVQDATGEWVADTTGAFGGNYASGDGRVACVVRELTGAAGWSYALKIHDRFAC